MPPKNSLLMLAFGSSVVIGVYNGTNRTSVPSACIADASMLSLRQLPQYIPPAPGVR